MNHPHTNTVSKPATVRRQHIYRIFEMHLKLRLTTENNFACIQTAISNLQGNQKMKIHNGYIHNKKKQYNHNTKYSHRIMRGKKKDKHKFKTSNKMTIRIYILIVTLNMNRLNAPTRRYRLADWIQK